MILIYSGGNSDSSGDFGGSVRTFRDSLEKYGIPTVGYSADSGLSLKFRKWVWRIAQIAKLCKPFGWQFSESALKLHQSRIQRKLSEHDYVVNFFQIGFSPNYRYFQVIDCTLSHLFSHYPETFRLSNRLKERALILEKQTYEKSQRIFVPSKSVQIELIKKYGIDSKKIEVALWSPNNFSSPPISEVIKCKLHSIEKQLEFLFIGKDFERKRLDKAIKLVNQLNLGGIPSHLNVVGGSVRLNVETNSETTYHGFLPNKSKKLLDLLNSCHIGVLFTDAEAIGISLLEFQYAGLITISSGKGGSIDSLYTDYCFIDKSEDLVDSYNYLKSLNIGDNAVKIFTESIQQGRQFKGFDAISNVLSGIVSFKSQSSDNC